MGWLEKFKKQNEEKRELKSVREALFQQGWDHLEVMPTEMLDGTEIILAEKNTIHMPIGELASLGSAVSSMLPAFRTLTQTVSVNTSGLYRLANVAAGDKLKIAKNGSFWGAFKRADGTSKFAQLVEAEPVSISSQTVMPLNPATMMMAFALYSIERQMDNILEMEKHILAFLEQEKAAQIEADLKMLTSITCEYKYNWDKEQYVASNHKLALDIKRTAAKNIAFYQKQIAEILDSKQFLVVNKTIDSAVKGLEKKYKYYRLSLYIYSFASFMEVMLLGNFQEEYILQVKGEIEKYSEEYHRFYLHSADYITKIAEVSIEANAMKGIGSVGKVLGNFIGSIPLIKEGPVDEWLMEGGSYLKQTGQNMKNSAPQKLEKISESGTKIFVAKLDEINHIYNHIDSIYFDRDNIYLVI